MSDQLPDDAVPPGASWVPGEAGVLPRGVAAAARARLDRVRSRAHGSGGSAAGTDDGDAAAPDSGAGTAGAAEAETTAGPTADAPGTIDAAGTADAAGAADSPSTDAARPSASAGSAAGAPPAPPTSLTAPPAALPVAGAAPAVEGGRPATAREAGSAHAPGAGFGDGPSVRDTGSAHAPASNVGDGPSVRDVVSAHVPPTGLGDLPAAPSAVHGLATTVVTAGLAPPIQGDPFLRGPVFAGPYHAAGEVESTPHLYGRMSNPGYDRYEEALGALDGGHSVVFASGMAAATAVLQCLLGPGDLLVAPNDGYPGVMQFAREHLGLRGVGVRLVPTDDEAIRRAAKGASVVWIESPANPGLQTLELEATIAVCRRAGARVVVDNTLATPLRQQPLSAGADLVVSSGSKHLTGHSDLILGHVSATDRELVDRLRQWRTLTGSVPGPFEIWLAHRSLGTLDVRLRRQEAVATAVFSALGRRDDIADVRYPGFSSVVGIDLGGMRRAKQFLSELQLVAEATSFGGLHSTAERRDRFGDGQVGPGYVRFSAGLESPDDIVADVTRALGAAD